MLGPGWVFHGQHSATTVSKYRLCKPTESIHIRYILHITSVCLSRLSPLLQCTGGIANSRGAILSCFQNVQESNMSWNTRTRWIHWPPELARPPKARWILGTKSAEIHRNQWIWFNLIQFGYPHLSTVNFRRPFGHLPGCTACALCSICSICSIWACASSNASCHSGRSEDRRGISSPFFLVVFGR